MCYLCIMKASNKRYYPYLLVLLWGILCWAFFQFCYAYHFFYQEQNQIFLLSWEHISHYLAPCGWLSRLIGDFLTQFYYYLYAGPIILTLTLLTLGDVARRLLARCGIKRIWTFLGAILLMTLGAVFCFHHSYRLFNIIAGIGFLTVMYVGAWLWGKRRWLNGLVMLIAAVIGYWLFGLPQWGKLGGPDFYLEKQFAVDNEYYFGHYQKVIDMVEHANSPTPEMKFFYNLVRAQQGKLPDYLLRFNNNELGTFYAIGPDTPMLTIKNMNELYWALGDMTFTERAAMMAHVFSPDNRNARMIKRLAECSIVSGDTLAANKYLRILDKTLAYRSWARKVRDQGDRIYQEKMQMVNQRDTITVSDNAHFIMMQLLDHNPKNKVALDYILCSTLLLKDMESFKRDYDRYCLSTGNLPTSTLYQEALCIYLAGTQAPEEEWKRYIQRPDILQRFSRYNEQRGNPQFKDTYWYYFDTTKAPKI